MDRFSDLDELVICHIAIRSKSALVMSVVSRRFRNCMKKLPDFESERMVIRFCYNCAKYGVSKAYLDFAAELFKNNTHLQNPLSVAISQRNLPAARYLFGKIPLPSDYNPFIHVLRYQMSDIGYDSEITNGQEPTNIDNVVGCYYYILESQFGFKLNEQIAKGPPKLLDRIAQFGYKKTFNWVVLHGIKVEPSSVLVAIQFGRNQLAEMLLVPYTGSMGIFLSQAVRYNNTQMVIYMMINRLWTMTQWDVIRAVIWGSIDVLEVLKVISREHGSVRWPTIDDFIVHFADDGGMAEEYGVSKSVWEVIMKTSCQYVTVEYLYNHMEGRTLGPLIIPKWDERAIFAALKYSSGDATEMIQWLIERGCPVIIELTQEYRTESNLITVFNLAGGRRDGSLEWLVCHFRKLGEKTIDSNVAAIGIDMNRVEIMELLDRGYVRHNIGTLRCAARVGGSQDVANWLDMQI